MECVCIYSHAYIRVYTHICAYIHFIYFYIKKFFLIWNILKRLCRTNERRPYLWVKLRPTGHIGTSRKDTEVPRWWLARGHVAGAEAGVQIPGYCSTRLSLWRAGMARGNRANDRAGGCGENTVDAARAQWRKRAGDLGTRHWGRSVSSRWLGKSKCTRALTAEEWQEWKYESLGTERDQGAEREQTGSHHNCGY